MGIFDSLSGGPARRRQHKLLLEQGKAMLDRFHASPATEYYETELGDVSNFSADLSELPLEFRDEAAEALEYLSVLVHRHETEEFGKRDVMQETARHIGTLSTIASRAWTPRQQAAFRARTYGRLFGWAQHVVEQWQGGAILPVASQRGLEDLITAQGWFPTNVALDTAVAALRDGWGEAWVSRKLATGQRAKLSAFASGDDYFAMLSVSEAAEVVNRYRAGLQRLNPQTR